MGTFDISRINYDKEKHYTSVRMQQGRVLTDDDWNEHARIKEENQRSSITEIIGPFGSPDDGFKIENLSLNANTGLINFDILAGVLYLGGLRLQLEKLETYRSQKDWLQQPVDIDGTPSFNANERYDLIYIESWQQPVSAVEDSSLFEVALGGPDTTTRLRNMRRVHIASDIGFANCSDAWHKLKSDWIDRKLGSINEEFELIRDITLKVTFSNTGLPEDLCTPSAAGGYLGAENQAIRVQLVDENHFTWGFDNASPLYRVAVEADGTTITMLTEPKDQYHWPLSNQVVEILQWSALLSNGEKVSEQMGHLTKVDASYDPDTGEFTLQEPVDPTFGADSQIPHEYFYLRVWNRGDDLGSDADISFTIGTPVSLGHTGLQVTFEGTDRVAGDYWVIAARPETPNRVVPWELEQGLAPHGVRRFFAPLAVIRWSTENDEVLGKVIHDCRKIFQPLTKLEFCCTFHVGDGSQSHGDFNSIEEAVANLPESGGKICVLPGRHKANVELLNLQNVRISGCGERSIVLPSLKRLEDPIFLISGAQNIQIDNLSMMTLKGKAIVLRDNDTPRSSQEILINDNHILAFINGIHISVDADRGGDNKVMILRNKIGMFDKEGGDVAIFSLADGVLIERNEIFVENPPNPDDPNDPRDPDDPNDPSDPCTKPEPFYAVGFPLAQFFFNFFLHSQRLFLLAPFVHQYKTKGGIQIGGSSERVRILENKISGGFGNGITLGHLPQMNPEDFQDDDVFKYNAYKDAASIDSFDREKIAAFVKDNFLSTLYEISIENNLIQRMGLSGIGLQTFFNIRQTRLLISLEDLTVYRNTIKNCARQIPEQFLNEIGFGGISLGDVNEAIIQENRLEDNGLSQADPICGLFILNGEKIDITNNHILNNGPFDPKLASPIRDGRRGGIVVANSFKQFKELADPKGNIQPIMFDNSFAIKVHNNVVIQPLGHALFLMAFGPVSVVGNQLCSQGIHARNPVNLLAGTIWILNLGFSKDLITQVILPKFKEVGNLTYEQNLSSGRTQNDQLNQLLTALQYLPSGRVLFANNQVTLDLRSAESTLAISSQLIFSLDDVAYNGNQAEICGYIGAAPGGATTFDIVVSDAFLLGYSVRSNDNRFQEGFAFALYSLISLGHMNTALGNQSTYCLLLYGTLTPPPVIFDGSNRILRPTLCQRDHQELGKAMAVPSEGYYMKAN